MLYLQNLVFEGLAVAGDLQPIDALIKRDKVDLKQWWEAGVKAFAFEGKQLGLPARGQIQHCWLYFNRDAFQRAGLREPAETWSLDDLVAAADRLTVRGWRAVRLRHHVEQLPARRRRHAPLRGRAALRGRQEVAPGLTASAAGDAVALGAVAPPGGGPAQVLRAGGLRPGHGGHAGADAGRAARRSGIRSRTPSSGAWC